MTKADEIRRLLGEGKSRSEIARALGVSYQRVYQVDVKRGNGGVPGGGSTSRRSVRVGTSSLPGRYASGYGRYWGVRVSAGASDVQVPEFTGKRRNPLRTGPSQVRIAVQDGHEVIAVQQLRGLECGSCKGRIQYSLRDLAYVHTDSKGPITRLIDLQSGPGLFD